MIAPFLVNALYTLGWLVESPIRMIHPTLSNRVGPLLFMFGLALGWFLCTVPPGFWLVRYLLP